MMSIKQGNDAGHRQKRKGQSKNQPVETITNQNLTMCDKHRQMMICYYIVYKTFFNQLRNT